MFFLGVFFMRYLTDEEYKIASRYLFLNMTIKTLQGDLKKVLNGNIFKVPEPFIKMLESAIEIATEERQLLTIKMRDHELKVVRSGLRRDFTAYTFHSGHREENRSFYNPAIRKKVKGIMEELFEVVDLKEKKPTPQ